jgi:RNA polymerase sigma factor (sigma-70 family)
VCRAISREPVGDDLEKLFKNIFPDVPEIVRRACIKLSRHPDQVDVDEIAQRVAYLLWNDNYRALRSFKYESSLETWLFAIAMRHILRWLREQGEIESLEDRLPDSFVVRQRQEERLLAKEREERVREAVGKLTEHDQKLYGLLRQELSIGKIAEEMKVKSRSVSVMKRVLIIRLQKIMGLVNPSCSPEK